MGIIDEYRKRHNVVTSQKENGTVAKPADAGDLKSPPNNSGVGSSPSGATGISSLTTKFFLIYELNTDLKDKNYFKPLELVETPFSLEYVRNYAQANYERDIEFCYVEEITRKTTIK